MCKKNGWIEGIVGEMCSGKSEELLRRAKRSLIAGQRVQAFKPKLNTRDDGIKSRASDTIFAAQIIKTPEQLLDMIDAETKVVILDEVQFFDNSIALVCNQLANMGYRVIWSGLDTDWRGEPFGPVPALMAISEIVDKLHAICTEPGCGMLACRSQRMTTGTNQIEVGHKYEARCRKHHKPS